MIKIKHQPFIDDSISRESLTAFICNGSYFLTNITIFKNSYIDCWGLLTLEEFIQKVEQGWVTVELDNSDDLEISIFGVGEITSGFEYIPYKTNQDLITEVKDIIAQLNQQPDSSERCWNAWHKYEKDQSENNQINLQQAYEAVPKHNRVYILKDQDLKDFPIRRAIYPNEGYSFQELLFSSEISKDLQNQIAENHHDLKSKSQEINMMQQLQQNLTELSSIKKKYEDDIQNFINQKLSEFHNEVNLPIQYLDVDIDNVQNNKRYKTHVSNFKIHINLET